MTYSLATQDLSGLQGATLETDAPSLSPRIVVAWLYGMFLLLPVKFVHLPSNLELVDVWVILALPFFWLSFVLGGRARLSMSYGLPILLILTATCLSALYAPSPARGLIVLLKEVYLFVWFGTLTALLSSLHPRALRHVMVVWAIVATLHGLLILAQFVSADVWQMSIGLAGQSATYADYRSSGLFISEKAGDANKAAFFQLMGFVPLILARFPKRVTTFLAMVLFISILGTGSMGTTTALMVGVVVSVITLLLAGNSFSLLGRYLTRLLVVTTLLVGSLTIVLSLAPSYRSHLDKIVTGRAEKSSGGRVALWQRGIDALDEHDVFLWGVGPENFREVDPSGNDNQLHNDFLAFTVERGLIGVAGLILLALIATGRAVVLLRVYSPFPEGAGLFVLVFLAAIAAIVTASLTHQIFHARELWIVLAVQEAMVFHARNRSHTSTQGYLNASEAQGTHNPLRKHALGYHDRAEGGVGTP